MGNLYSLSCTFSTNHHRASRTGSAFLLYAEVKMREENTEQNTQVRLSVKTSYSKLELKNEEENPNKIIFYTNLHLRGETRCSRRVSVSLLHLRHPLCKHRPTLWCHVLVKNPATTGTAEGSYEYAQFITSMILTDTEIYYLPTRVWCRPYKIVFPKPLCFELVR